MHRIHSIALATGLVAAVGIGTAYAQTPPPSYPQTQPPKTTQPDKPAVPQMPATTADADFAQKAMMGGKHEIDGANLVLTKTTNADVKALANRLIKDHEAANNELSSLAKDLKTTIKDEAKKEAEAWRAMSGAAFDRGWADHLIAEHQKTITLYETEANSGSDAKLKAFAAKTLPTIREHLKAAQDLRSKLGTT